MKARKYDLLSFVLRWILLTNAFLVISIDSCNEENSSSSSSLDDSNKPATALPMQSPSSTDENKKNIKLSSFAESIKRSRNNKTSDAQNSKDRWKSALEEIKDLAVPRSSSGDADAGNEEISLFRRWRSLLNEPTKLELDPNTKTTTATVEKDTNESFSPYSGSWERMLQDWSDDVQEYIERVESENKGYPMSQFGNAEKLLEKEAEKPTEVETRNHTNQLNPSKTSYSSNGVDNQKNNHKSKEKAIRLPVPAPKKMDADVVPHTDIAIKSKRILIVTTAALPWMTGTAVNPLLRAAYMTTGRKEEGGSVTLMLPWLERRHDQEQVYGPKNIFNSQKEQEIFIRNWLRDSAKLLAPSKELKIKWYTAWQNKAENSVYSMGDITALIPKEEVDICILEEPEHLNWYRAPGDSWTDKFQHVVGIIHTNYFVYAQDQPAAFIRAPGMRLLCSWMCRAHCHRIIKLSGTLGQFAPEKELIENVHGIRASFLDAGKEVSRRIEISPKKDAVFGEAAKPSVYFIGKMLWSKGIGSLMELLQYADENAGIKIQVDMYGGGPDKVEAEERSNSLGVNMTFHGPIDHAELAFTHKIFINPSTSEVLCTTVAEALGMGKFVVVPSHPSNDFFVEFPNCLVYTNKEEFVGNLYYALTHSPEPLTSEYSHALSWEAATERLEAASSIPVEEAELRAEALSSSDAGFEITLPPLIEDVEDRKIMASGLRQSRARYRMFRSRLSQEVSQSNVLPNRVKQSLVNELDKRLDLDIDFILQSPKLRLQLSPAELDKKLLELYKNVADGPRGDALRIIGGGNDVALQDLYIRRNKGRSKNRRSFLAPAGTEDNEDKKRTTSQWVNSVLKKELPKTLTENESDNLKMSLRNGYEQPFSQISSSQTGFTSKFCVGRTPMSKFCLLI
mmetsp:Transcript_11917/g.28251  ORF Transcript_11917/g.28251 Transcript_11917/m.28251 type:complete len:906 (-) Transcript_11917:1089-3806(-)|eukprot:CAMPEP_0197177122 /NCGR_PEP_ID=MMETSP1423-20130617/2838_1 /TAXON_ID=476441 /ORGANISM="Pseudo-nitzschia heimii, Strain UNC1101" /LENGTH=905 /DNA_ID=CAMNT_0042626621 /DNA_START=83 /DNA_END=2800 /DNA_ORIENTATION=+